jgi:hypothetical protein
MCKHTGRHKDTIMKPNLFFKSTFLILLGFSSCQDSDGNILSDKIYQDTLRQNIGGSLIRDIHYYNDFHSWDRDVTYLYKDKFGNIFKIGNGNFHGQELPKNEQLIQFNSWTILNTNEGFHCKIIIGDLTTKNFVDYELSPETIGQDLVWQKQNIGSDPNNGDSKVTFENFNSDSEFSVIYKFANKGRIFSFMTSKRRVNYKINIQTGRPEITSVSEL